MTHLFNQVNEINKSVLIRLANHISTYGLLGHNSIHFINLVNFIHPISYIVERFYR